MALCLTKTCCCGKELSSGVQVLAIVEAILNFFFIAIPYNLQGVVPHASYTISWIVVIILVNVILFIGAKASRPAFMTLWLILYIINVILVIGVWIAIPVNVILNDAGDTSWIRPNVEDIPKDPFWMIFVVLAFLVMLIEPVLQIYYIIVVNSLRRRILMEIRIGFNSNRQEIQDPSEGPWKWMGQGLNPKVAPRPQRY